MENTKNINLVYGVVGLVIGLLIAGGSCWNNHHRTGGKYFSKRGDYSSMMHQMPDGTIMMNDGGMEGMMHGMMMGLEGKTGEEFDKAFLSGMIIHHEGAVEMANAVLKNSNRPEMINLANDIIAAQTSEIKMMQEWQKAWYK